MRSLPLPLIVLSYPVYYLGDVYDPHDVDGLLLDTTWDAATSRTEAHGSAESKGGA